MKSDRINTFLLLLCVALLVVNAVGVWTRPSLDEIDRRIQTWGQHYGAHFSR